MQNQKEQLIQIFQQHHPQVGINDEITITNLQNMLKSILSTIPDSSFNQKIFEKCIQKIQKAKKIISINNYVDFHMEGIEIFNFKEEILELEIGQIQEFLTQLKIRMSERSFISQKNQSHSILFNTFTLKGELPQFPLSLYISGEDFQKCIPFTKQGNQLILKFSEKVKVQSLKSSFILEVVDSNFNSISGATLNIHQVSIQKLNKMNLPLSSYSMKTGLTLEVESCVEINNCQDIQQQKQLIEHQQQSLKSELQETYESIRYLTKFSKINNKNKQDRSIAIISNYNLNYEKEEFIRQIQENQHQNNININFEEAYEFLKQYDYFLLDFLGRGALGFVFKGYYKQKNNIVAIKMVQFEQIDVEYLLCLLMEVQQCKLVKHQNVIRVFDKLYNDENLQFFMMMEFCSQQFNDYIENNQLSQTQIIDIFKSILNGIKAIHDKNIIHGDLKPDNILITSENVIKICDFGVSLQLQERENKINSNGGTFAYMAMEVMEHNQQMKESDIFSAGIILLQLCGMNITGDINLMFGLKNSIFPNPNQYNFPGLIEIGYQMIKRNYEDRISIDQALANLDKIKNF